MTLRKNVTLKKVLTIMFLVIMFALSESCPASAQSTQPVTIVYDVHAREFTCWYEGARILLTSSSCTGDKLHPFYNGVHFFRGQSIYLQYFGAHVADLFAPAITANDLAEPAIPIFGQTSTLPSVNTVGPAESLVLGSTVKQVAGENDPLLVLYAMLDRLRTKGF